MSPREEKIIEAAINVISRYGLRRTTMADIAAETGISRQTLYASFKNKEEVLTAVIRVFSAKKLEAITTAWSGLETVEEKLDAFFAIGIIPYFEQLRAMPDFGDLIGEFGKSGDAEKQKTIRQKTEALAALFEPYEDRLKQSGATAERLAGLIVSSADSFVFTAHDRAHLDSLLGSLKLAVLCQLGIKPAKQGR